MTVTYGSSGGVCEEPKGRPVRTGPYRIGVFLAVLGVTMLGLVMAGAIALAVLSSPVVGLLVTGGCGVVLVWAGLVLMDIEP